jgi:hypothetical protein
METRQLLQIENTSRNVKCFRRASSPALPFSFFLVRDFNSFRLKELTRLKEEM